MSVKAINATASQFAHQCKKLFINNPDYVKMVEDQYSIFNNAGNISRKAIQQSILETNADCFDKFSGKGKLNRTGKHILLGKIKENGMKKDVSLKSYLSKLFKLELEHGSEFDPFYSRKDIERLMSRR